ncbi:MAG TPA: hypothetical protein VFT12_13535 [Thermoanaerobaculia bacterium]|nr:hypothetical protein [Thermoanaerobaculia bacterium]
MNAATLLLVITTTLVLHSGDRIDISGSIREENGRAVFRVPGGALYSLPLSEIDRAATAALEEDRRNAARPSSRKLKVSAEERDRLLAELAKNRNGQPPLPSQFLEQAITPPPTPAQRAAEQDEEWRWRRAARDYEENVRRAEEHLQLLVNRMEDLEGEIRGFLSLGYKPREFTYQTTMLVSIREQIPAAELAVTQARRAYDQFREDARRQGVLPGWLR